MPFGSQSSMDFFDSLPPLEEARAVPSSSSQSLFEGLEGLKQNRILYRLCLVDEAGRPVNYPSEADLRSFLDSRPKAAHPEQPAPVQQAEQQPKEPSFQELLAETQRKGGPVCSHCGATESPQWRRGPPNKAILCNACGTRYRRTNQLGSTIPSNQRKRSAAQQQQHCGSEALKQQPAAKQPRVVA